MSSTGIILSPCFVLLVQHLGLCVLLLRLLLSQRALAEVTEMIRTSHLVHKGLVNIYPGLYREPVVLSDMMFGNKIALLGGDYLLGNCCAELAALRNQNVIGLYLMKCGRLSV